MNNTRISMNNFYRRFICLFKQGIFLDIFNSLTVLNFSQDLWVHLVLLRNLILEFHLWDFSKTRWWLFLSWVNKIGLLHLSFWNFSLSVWYLIEFQSFFSEGFLTSGSYLIKNLFKLFWCCLISVCLSEFFLNQKICLSSHTCQYFSDNLNIGLFSHFRGDVIMNFLHMLFF